MKKRYETLLATGALIAALGFAAPALADTAPTNQAQTPPSGWVAHPLGMRDEPGEHRLGVFGTVTAVSGTTLTVTQKAFSRPGANANSAANNTPAQTAYTVDAANATVIKDGSTSTLANVAVGDTVMVQGTVSGTTVTATAIRDGLPHRHWDERAETTPVIQGNGQPILGGSVTAVSGTTLTVTNKGNVAYTVDAANATVEKNHATSTVSAIAVGDNVIVQGTVNGTSITASSVIDSGAAPAANANASTNGVEHGVFGFFRGVGGFFAHLFGF